jgi:chemotaxis protein CheD
MKKVIDVQIGHVAAASGKTVLRSSALGSCVAVAVWDDAGGVGAMAHIMLPGKSPDGKESIEKTKYAADAIDAILEKMAAAGSACEKLEGVIVGGANVLQKPDDTICPANIDSVLSLLGDKRTCVVARAVGGIERRSIFFDLESKVVSHSHGDGAEEQLWQWS